MKTIITSVVAHIDHGKTTLIDSLVATQGKISTSLAGDLRYMDTRDDEQLRGITLKLSAISLNYKNNNHIIVDTPGHVDFEYLIENSSILSDNFLVIIDIMEGITPRIYSLVKYIRKESSVLIINKFDKVESPDEAVEKIERIIFFMNTLVGEKIFAWENNNVILSSATLCYGINYKNSQNIINKENINIPMITKFIFFIEEKIQNNDIEKICKRFNIRKPSRKNIMSAVLPLADSIFSSITHIYKTDGNIGYLWDSSVPLKIHSDIHNSKTLCFISLGMLNNQRIYKKEELLFIARLFQGKIKVNYTVFERETPIVVEKLFKFGINELIEVEELEDSELFAIKGNFRKNTLICADKSVQYEYTEKIKPFYRRRYDMPFDKDKEEIKEILRAIVHTEQCLRIKINKYNQIDLFAAGKVQVEKMIEDLKHCNIMLKEVKDEFMYCEFASGHSNYYYKDNDIILNIEIYKNDDSEYHDYVDEFDNRFILINSEEYDLILSILEIYVLEGPLIHEYIRSTTFKVDLQFINAIENVDQLYSQLRTHINNAYLEGNPSIVPYYYKLGISHMEEYYGAIYNAFRKYQHILLSEEYDDMIGFHKVEVLIPYFLYDLLVEDIRICTKGTAYITSHEYGYHYELDFSSKIDQIRKSKGLQINEKIITNPEKQRTLKK